MNDKLKDVDNMLMDLVDLAKSQVDMAKQKKYFSRDLAEAVGVVISLAYGRMGKNDK